MVICVFACSSKDGPPGDAGFDGGTDSATGDGGTDAGTDSAVDAGVDAETDAGFDAFDAGPLTGDDYLFVLDVLDLGAPDPAGDPTIVPGFDLDDVVSDGTEVETCRTEDFTSPPPDSEMGVDNALGPLLAEQEDMFNIRANLRNSVRGGLLLVMFNVRGVDDLVNDDRVEVDVLFGLLPSGTGSPALAGTRFVPGQTFDIDARSLEADMMTARVSLPGRIIDGRVQAGPGSLGLAVPFGTEVVMLQLDRVEMRADITATTLANGIIGGALDVEETAVALAPISDFDIAVIRLVLGGAADLDRVGGSCTAASLGLVFDGVDAVEGVVRAP